MEKINEELKNRTVSSASSASSVTEYVNETFEDSELELSKVVSIQVQNADSLSEEMSSDMMDVKGTKNLREFSDLSSENLHSSFIPRGFRKMYLAALVVLLFAVCMGVTGTYSATATADMKKPHSSIHPTEDEISWIASLMAVGALIGGTAGGKLDLVMMLIVKYVII